LLITKSSFVDEGAAHLLQLTELAEKDPEFYQYLEENDRDLLDFDPDREDEDLMEDVGMGQSPELTKQEVQKWQKALLEVWLVSSIDRTS
jgi:nucleolar complex protein 2